MRLTYKFDPFYHNHNKLLSFSQFRLRALVDVTTKTCRICKQKSALINFKVRISNISCRILVSRFWKTATPLRTIALTQQKCLSFNSPWLIFLFYFLLWKDNTNFWRHFFRRFSLSRVEVSSIPLQTPDLFVAEMSRMDSWQNHDR